MKNVHRLATCIMLLAGTVMFIGCSNSPTTVDSYVTPPSQQFTEDVSCPPMEEVAEAVVAELNANCPRTAHYRNWGAENSCEKRTVGQMLESYDGCYSGDELKELRIRIFELRHAADRGPDDEPTPQQQ